MSLTPYTTLFKLFVHPSWNFLCTHMYMCPFKPCLPFPSIYSLTNFFFTVSCYFVVWLYHNFVLCSSFSLYSSNSQWIPMCFFLYAPDSFLAPVKAVAFSSEKFTCKWNITFQGVQLSFLLPLQYPFRVPWAPFRIPAL